MRKVELLHGPESIGFGNAVGHFVASHDPSIHH
jgi:hypothetical protein